MTVDDEGGGPAFPQLETRGNLERWKVGMSLRDYFAAKALPSVYHGWVSIDPAEIAKVCFELADAMLRERAK